MHDWLGHTNKVLQVTDIFRLPPFVFFFFFFFFLHCSLPFHIYSLSQTIHADVKMGAQEPFKVIIAGASVAGLTLANALEKAGVEYLVLEKGDIAPQLGASIGILCHVAKVLEQLGIREQIRDITIPLLQRQNFDEYGHLFDDCQLFKGLAAKTKRPVMFLERRAYLQALYDNLKDKSRVRDHIGLKSFAEDDEGVTVFTSTGEEVRGSILVGADGVHSTVRKLLAESVAKSDPERAVKLNEGFTAHYRAIFGISRNQQRGDPTKQLLADGSLHDRYYRGHSGVAASGVSGLIFWFLFVKQDSPSTSPNCPRYSEADTEDTMRKYGHLSVGPGYTFNDLWEVRLNANMVPLEEGIIEASWNSGGRVVMVGDAVFKATVNAGLGGSTAVECVCNLVNELLPVLKETKIPNKQDVKGVFDRYEAKQRPRSKTSAAVSAFQTRFETMDTWWLRIFRVIFPWIPASYKVDAVLNYMAGAPVFDFLPDPDRSSP